MHQPQRKIDLAIDLSQQILELARQGDWSQIDQLDAKMMRLLQDIFSGCSLDKNNEGARTELQRLALINNEALELCAKAKESMQTDVRKFRRGREAVSAYQKHISLN